MSALLSVFTSDKINGIQIGTYDKVIICTDNFLYRENNA